MSSLRLASIALDCDNPLTLASFWANLLDGEIAFTSDDFVAVKLDHLWLTTTKVEHFEPPSWPDGPHAKQMHLDLAVKDLLQATDDAVALGARRAEHQPAPDRYVVLYDPAGHPFCVTTQIPD